jgi:hypothetical protein
MKLTRPKPFFRQAKGAIIIDPKGRSGITEDGFLRSLGMEAESITKNKNS